MGQLLCHIFGDYILQSDWMAINKSKNSKICLIHVILYTLPFLFLTLNWKSLIIIGSTHFLLDRFPIIVKSIIWIKNHIGPGFKYVSFDKCSITGYYDNVFNELNGKFYDRENVNGFSPRLNYVTIWLYIITDNFIHLLINHNILKYIG